MLIKKKLKFLNIHNLTFDKATKEKNHPFEDYVSL